MLFSSATFVLAIDSWAQAVIAVGLLNLERSSCRNVKYVSARPTVARYESDVTHGCPNKWRRRHGIHLKYPIILKDCQIKDWKEGGHKKACRPPKDFKARDIIRVKNVRSRPVLNGFLVEVRGPALVEKRWLASCVGAAPSEEILNLHEDEMHLAVPVEERVDL